MYKDGTLKKILLEKKTQNKSNRAETEALVKKILTF